MPHKEAVPLHKVCGDGFNSKVGGFASIIIDDKKYDAQEVARAVTVSKADADRMKWQPIATAPKDGTRILIHTISPATGNEFVHLAWWAIPYEGAPDERGWWETGLHGEHHPVVPAFTHHWMPVPKPPLADRLSAKE